MRDRTAQAVAQQVEAMGCQTFEVGIFDANAEKMLTKTWDREAVLKSVPYLKYQNMQGKHIYIRPAGAHNLTMVDDLSAAKVEQMKKDGFAPAAVVETSPNNYQAWVKHHATLPTELSTRASRELASTYGGDPGSADWRHYGRLAGFTNCKKKYQQANGLYPFVLLKEASGQGYDQASTFITAVELKLSAEKKAEQERRAHFAALPPSASPRASKTIADFRNDSRYGGDYHRADLGYATYALSRNVSENEVVAAILSRDLSHKGSIARQTEYAERTVKKALENTQGQPHPQPGRSSGRGA